MISSTHNPLVKHLVKLRENKKYREEQGRLVVSGYKLIRELTALSPPLKLFVENLSDAPDSIESYLVTPAVLKKISGLSTPEPIAAEFSLPPPSSLMHQAPLLVLDAIRDPGNLGTLLRTALALGWGGVYLLPTCVDPFHEKVIRASRAALFHLPWRIGSWEELKELKESQKLSAYIADMEGEPLSQVHFTKNSLLLLSNEAQGVRPQDHVQGQKIAIPMHAEMESLNVAIAGGILMYGLGRE